MNSLLQVFSNCLRRIPVISSTQAPPFDVKYCKPNARYRTDTATLMHHLTNLTTGKRHRITPNCSCGQYEIVQDPHQLGRAIIDRAV